MSMGIEGIWPYSKRRALKDATDVIDTHIQYVQENFGFLKLCFPVEGKNKQKYFAHMDFEKMLRGRKV